MTPEEKDLLLKDLFGRIPYGVKCSYLDIEFNNTTYGNLENFEYDDDKDVIFVIDGIGIYSEHIKPYLFPLSSMTEEQLVELRMEHEKDLKNMAICMKKCSEGDNSMRGKNISYHAVDWCNKNNFDFRGLIPLGLAIDATGLNIY